MKNNITETESDCAEPFHFPQGMAGFSEAKDYAFIYQGHGDIMCIQSTEQPEASFLITPWDEQRLGATPVLSADLCHCIQINQQNEIMWVLVLNPFVDEQWVTANLKAPVALNAQARLGLQCIRQEPTLDLRYPWIPQP